MGVEAKRDQVAIARSAARQGLSAPALQRSHGQVGLSVKSENGVSRLDRLSQSGSARLLFPRSASAAIEAVIVNTSGGLAGGDRFDVAAEAGDGARLVLTTQAAEKVYRSLDTAAETTTRLALGARSQLHWLPQEAILFNAARLDRRLEVEMAMDAELLVAESVVFGRQARGEVMQAGRFADRWRVRRGGRLIFAEQALFDGDIAQSLTHAAVACGGTAMCCTLLVTPDAEARLEKARAVMQAVAGREGGVSAWNGMLALRLVAATGQLLRERLRALLRAIRGIDVPAVWQF